MIIESDTSADHYTADPSEEVGSDSGEDDNSTEKEGDDSHLHKDQKSLEGR